MKIVCGLVVLACATYLANAADGECTDYGNPNSPQCPGWAPCCSTNGYCGNGAAWCEARGKRSVLVDHSRRRRAGECSSDYDCPSWAPCCSSYGYCGNQWEWCAGRKWKVGTNWPVDTCTLRKIRDKKNFKNDRKIYLKLSACINYDFINRIYKLYISL